MRLIRRLLLLENQKDISRIYVRLNDVSIHNKNTWRQTMDFHEYAMMKRDFEDYKDIIDS